MQHFGDYGFHPRAQTGSQDYGPYYHDNFLGREEDGVIMLRLSIVHNVAFPRRIVQFAKKKTRRLKILLGASSLGVFKKVKAGAPGFEPRSTDSKSGVLPLHHAPITASGRILAYNCPI
jgi:hypothetical protein